MSELEKEKRSSDAHFALMCQKERQAWRLHEVLARHGIVSLDVPLTTVELSQYIGAVLEIECKPEDIVDPDLVLDTYTYDWKRGLERELAEARSDEEDARLARRKAEAENAVLRARLICQKTDLEFEEAERAAS